MAELIAEREIASVSLLTFELSEGEIDALVACINYVLQRSDKHELEQSIGAYREELEAIRDDLSYVVEESEQTPDLTGLLAEPA